MVLLPCVCWIRGKGPYKGLTGLNTNFLPYFLILNSIHWHVYHQLLRQIIIKYCTTSYHYIFFQKNGSTIEVRFSWFMTIQLSIEIILSPSFCFLVHIKCELFWLVLIPSFISDQISHRKMTWTVNAKLCCLSVKLK